MRVWEDMYGRNLFFFFPSIVYFLQCGKHNENISFFELEESVRWYFALRLASTLCAYGFFALAITEGDGVLTPILVLFFSQSFIRLFWKSNTNSTFQIQSDHEDTKTHRGAAIVIFLASIAGLCLQFTADKEKQIYFSVISSVMFTISQMLLQQTKAYIHHSIDTIYVSLALTLVMPSFVLGDYSLNPAKFTIESS